MAHPPSTPTSPAQGKNRHLMEIVRRCTFPCQYRETLHQTLTQTPVLLETLTAQLVGIALAKYSPQIQTEPSTLTLALEALLECAFGQHQLWDKISQEVWVNLLTWTVQDLEIPIATTVIQSIAQAPYRADLWQLLIGSEPDPPNSGEPFRPSSALEPLLETLETLICQDLIAQILENPQTLEPLFLGLSPQQSLLEISLPPLTIHPCNALEELSKNGDRSQSLPTPLPLAPSPAVTPLVLEHYLTRPSELHRLPWELMGQIKQHRGLPIVQLLFLLMGHVYRPPHCITLTYREILEQLDWEETAGAGEPSPPPDLPDLLAQLSTLTITTLWMSEPTAVAPVKAISTSGHPWEILSEAQGTFDWVTGRISSPAESSTELSITLKPGLWLNHLLEKGGLSARSAWETFGQLALTLLERDHCREPFLISLLMVLSLNAPEPQPEVRPAFYTVHTLLDAVLPATAIDTLHHHPDIAPALFKTWSQALASLVSLGWTSRRPVPEVLGADVLRPQTLEPESLEPQTTDFYIAPFPDWLDIHCDRRKPSDWIAQWLAQPLQFIAPHSIRGFSESSAPSVRPTPSALRTQRRLRGAEIRSARKAKQLTQSQLADVLHVHQSLIAKIEVGQRTVTEALERSLRQVLEL